MSLSEKRIDHCGDGEYLESDLKQSVKNFLNEINKYTELTPVNVECELEKEFGDKLTK